VHYPPTPPDAARADVRATIPTQTPQNATAGARVGTGRLADAQRRQRQAVTLRCS
jgi:hypothetical protein